MIIGDWENRCGPRGKGQREREEVDKDLGQTAGCYPRRRRVAALSGGGGRPERPLREKGKRRGSWGGNTEERGRAVRGGRGVSRKTSVSPGVRTRWVPGQNSEGDVRSREPDDRAAEARRRAAGARGEPKREEALQGAGAPPGDSGSPRGSLPAPCPSRSAWVGGSGRWTWRRYLRGGNREA